VNGVTFLSENHIIFTLVFTQLKRLIKTHLHKIRAVKTENPSKAFKLCYHGNTTRYQYPQSYTFCQPNGTTAPNKLNEFLNHHKAAHCTMSRPKRGVAMTSSGVVMTSIGVVMTSRVLLMMSRTRNMLKRGQQTMKVKYTMTS